MIKKWWRKRTERSFFSKASRTEVFDWIYDTNKWGSDESRSGKGSELNTTAGIRAELVKLLDQLGVESVLDLPCGDMHWMQELDLTQRYIGADIVESLVQQNQISHPHLKFMVLDACSDPFPDVDFILMRDLTVHLSYRDIKLVMQNLAKSSATYLACTTYPRESLNRDKLTGNHRRLNMLLDPFNWPEPLHLIEETDPHHKALGVWRVEQLTGAS